MAPWLGAPGGAGQGHPVPSREDEPDDVLILNASDDFQQPATPATGLYVNIENPL